MRLAKLERSASAGVGATNLPERQNNTQDSNQVGNPNTFLNAISARKPELKPAVLKRVDSHNDVLFDIKNSDGPQTISISMDRDGNTQVVIKAQGLSYQHRFNVGDRKTIVFRGLTTGRLILSGYFSKSVKMYSTGPMAVDQTRARFAPGVGCSREG